jgi:hypothetical protein
VCSCAAQQAVAEGDERISAEGERGRGDPSRKHVREEREGIRRAAGAGAGGDEGVEVGSRRRWARARRTHPVEQAAGVA